MRGEIARLRTKLDKLWAQLIKLKAGNKCEYCGKTKGLNSHHIFSRSRKSTRWDLDNGSCLCVACHTFSSTFSAHKTGVEFTYWLEEKKGKEFMDKLRLKANQVSKMYIQDYRDLVERFKTLKKELECIDTKKK